MIAATIHRIASRMLRTFPRLFSYHTLPRPRQLRAECAAAGAETQEVEAELDKRKAGNGAGDVPLTAQAGALHVLVRTSKP